MDDFAGIHLDTSNMKTDISFTRFSLSYKRAQLALDVQIMNDMIPYMPMQTGMFMQRTVADSMSIAGTGEVVAGAKPFGRFLYGGKVMVGVSSHNSYAMQGESKVVTDKDLDYHKGAHPKVVPEWFKAAKANHGASWSRLVKRVAGGGL